VILYWAWRSLASLSLQFQFSTKLSSKSITLKWSLLKTLFRMANFFEKGIQKWDCKIVIYKPAFHFFTTCLMAVLQPSRYSVFHSRDTPIQHGLLWWSYPCQCLNTETSTWGNRGFTTEIPSISYTICLYIRLVVIL